jgi:hypothetical protein
MVEARLRSRQLSSPNCSRSQGSAWLVYASLEACLGMTFRVTIVRSSFQGVIGSSTVELQEVLFSPCSDYGGEARSGSQESSRVSAQSLDSYEEGCLSAVQQKPWLSDAWRSAIVMPVCRQAIVLHQGHHDPVPVAAAFAIHVLYAEY